jgi:type IV pilus assembly protein PilW
MARANLHRPTPARRIGAGFRALRGFTMIELLIALTIGIFLTGALLTIVQMNRTVFGNQSLLSQLQDNERLAMSMMSDVVQSAGYFPNPTLYTAGNVFPASGSFGSQQWITGTYGGGAAPGDSLTVRYMTASGDGNLTCSGQPNTSGGNVLYVSQFQVVQVNATTSQLVCTVGGTAYALATGITNMTVLYGVQTNAAAPGRNVDSYMNAAQVTNWSNVISVLVTMTFTNPLYNNGNSPGQPPTFQIQRLMQVLGVGGPTL